MKPTAPAKPSASTGLKVLIAEDDHLSRTVLATCLRGAGYELQLFDNGIDALRALEAVEEPVVALLDWMLPGLDGPDICRRLRAGVRKVRPYIIIVSAKNRSNEIAAGLDAGADDFLCTPVLAEELLARMRVAGRTLRYQLELQKQIEKFEVLAERYSLLGEIVAQQLQPRENVALETEVLAEMDAQTATPPPAPTRLDNLWFAAGEIETLVPRALTDLGLAANPAVAPAGERSSGVASLMAWAGFIDPVRHRWIDLLLEIDPKGAALVYQRALRRTAGSPRELLGFLDEIHTVISATLRAALQAKGCPTLAPLLSCTRQRDLWDPALRIPPERDAFRFDLGGAMLDLIAVCYPCEPQLRPPADLHPQEILAAAYPPDGSDGTILLPACTALDRNSLDRIRQYTASQAEPPPVPVYPLTPVALHFQRPPSTRPEW